MVLRLNQRFFEGPILFKLNLGYEISILEILGLKYTRP